MKVTAYSIAQRFVGIKEVPGSTANPMILAMLQLDDKWPKDDSVPWCSGYINYIAWLLRLPRSKSLRARSWLNVGIPVKLEDAQVGFDVVILKRGGGNQPGPEVINAPGHVGLYGGRSNGGVLILGGNQGDSVSTQIFDTDRILGIRNIQY